MIVRPIASSSKGNAYLVEHDGGALLIDCGISFRRLKDYKFDAVLITHNHVDHIQGLKTLASKTEIPFYANQMTAEATAGRLGISEDNFVIFENDQTFEIGPFTISPFSIPHDAADPVGYVIEAGGERYFHATDVGRPLGSIGEKLAKADYATLESNHDLVMLRTGTRPQELKDRIAGPRGHLSNDEAAELVKRYATKGRLKKLFLAHLSGECNQPHLASGCMMEALASAGLSEVELEIVNA